MTTHEKRLTLTDAQIDEMLDDLGITDQRQQRRIIARFIVERELLLAACKRVMQLQVSASGDEVFDEVREAVAIVEPTS